MNGDRNALQRVVNVSKIATVDGRSASIGLDTCVFHDENKPALLTAFNLQTLEVRQIERVEPWDSTAREHAVIF